MKAHPDDEFLVAVESKRTLTKVRHAKSARTFVWVSAGSTSLGMVIMSSAASLLLYVFAALFAVIAIIVGIGHARIVAAVLFVIALVMITVTYPQYDAEMTLYREHVIK